MLQETVARNGHKGKVVVFFALLLGVAVWHNSQLKAEAPMNLIATLPGRIQSPSAFKARCNAYWQTHPIAPAQMKPYLRSAAWSGARDGCRGSLTCMRAVGLYYGTSTGNTEEVAGMIGEKSGVSPTSIDDVTEAKDFEGFDGLIVGAPTWNTGADEQRSGTSWDDFLEDISGLSLSGKKVAVFGVGDSAGYGDNFCDAIEELHSTFAAAGAEMVGATSSEGYSHTESKSEADGKFLGLPLDQDNESDMTEDRVSKWVDQLKSEGMPF